MQAAADHRRANYQAGAGIAAFRPHFSRSVRSLLTQHRRLVRRCVRGAITPLERIAMVGRTKNLMLGLVISATALVGACASMGQRSIAEVQTNPGKFHDKTVTVEGVVTTSFGIPLVPLKVFRVSDGTAEMLVISDDSRIPGKNARVRVRGEVQEFALIGGGSFGLHLREKSIKYL
jgi:hypothetical protein